MKEVVRQMFADAVCMRNETRPDPALDTYTIIRQSNGQPLHRLDTAKSEAKAWKMAADAIGVC